MEIEFKQIEIQLKREEMALKAQAASKKMHRSNQQSAPKISHMAKLSAARMQT